MPFAIAVLLAALGLDLVAHAAGLPDLEAVAHAAATFAMVGLIVLVLIRRNRVKGDPDAVR
jgi:hypothetical protein